MLDRSIDLPFTDEELDRLSHLGPTMNQGFGQNACAVNGVGAEQAAAVQADFREMLDVLSVHFAHNRFLLGGRPCLADFALAGASKAHFITDPEPKSWLKQHEDDVRPFSRTNEKLVEDNALPNTLSDVLDYFARTYFVSSAANIAAGLAGEKFYEYDIGHGVTRARTARRLNQARLHVKGELKAMRQDSASSQTGILS